MTAPGDRSEAAREALSRDIEALTARWSGIVAAAAARHGFDDLDRDDLMQRLRVRLWRALERRRPGDPPLEAGYAHASAMSAAIDITRERRAQRVTAQVSLDAADLARANPEPGPGEAEITLVLERALQTLETSRRVAVRLHLAGRHASEIARMGGWSEARTRNLLYRGLADLRQALEGEA